jgi:hypothetical protein
MATINFNIKIKNVTVLETGKFIEINVESDCFQAQRQEFPSELKSFQPLAQAEVVRAPGSS